MGENVSAKRLCPNASPPATSLELVVATAQDKTGYLIKCSDGCIFLNGDCFQKWHEKGRRAPRYWEIVVGYNDTQWGMNKRVIDLTQLGYVDRYNVSLLVKFLHTGVISEHHILTAQTVATVCGGCVALDNVELRIREERARKDKLRRDNPMTPEQDVDHKFEWRIDCGGFDGFSVTVRAGTDAKFYYRRIKQQESDE